MGTPAAALPRPDGRSLSPRRRRGGDLPSFLSDVSSITAFLIIHNYDEHVRGVSTYGTALTAATAALADGAALFCHRRAADAAVEVGGYAKNAVRPSGRHSPDVVLQRRIGQTRQRATAVSSPSPSSVLAFSSSRRSSSLPPSPPPLSQPPLTPSSPPPSPPAEAPKRESSLPQFVHGAAASFVNIVTTFPANKLMFRQQVEGLTVRAAFGSLRSEGLRQLYRGIGPPLLQRSASMSIMFGLYDTYYKLMEQYWSSSPFFQSHGARVVTASLLAGSTEALLCPFERIQALLQHRHYTERFDNTWDAALKLRHYGFKEYYRGLSAILMRNGPSNALFFSLRQPLRDLIPAPADPQSGWNVWRDFFSGALLGALLSTLFFPINVAKNVMQAEVGGPTRSVGSTLLQLVRQRGGVLRVFRGVQINFSRSLLSWGIINSSYEFFRRTDTFGLQRRLGNGRPAE